MPTEIELNQDKILAYLYRKAYEDGKHEYIPSGAIHQGTGLEPLQINQAVELLRSEGLIEWLQALGTAPYIFHSIKLTALGAYEFQRRQEFQKETEKVIEAKKYQEGTVSVEDLLSILTKLPPPTAIGSPYGFKAEDWETISRWKAKKKILYVVLGSKFDSKYFDLKQLIVNIKEDFQNAVHRFNRENSGANIELKFEPLHAGYGEHLFNEIARDIIASDIAVFETSDMAPNVFIEIGVALTWGSRVFPIKNSECPKPPSDISGQTYADYSDNGKTFVDSEHEEKLYRMVERAIRTKG